MKLWMPGNRAFAGVFAPVLTAALLLFPSCSRDGDQARPTRDARALSVFVNTPPQAYLVGRIGGEFVDVNVLIPPGKDPHTFAPTARQITELGAADIYFHGIMPFGKELARKAESWETAVLVVDITEGIELRRIEEHDHHEDNQGDHNGGHGQDHARGQQHPHHSDGMDPHVWLSPPEIKVQARNIARALQETDSERAEVYNANLEAFIREVDKVHRRLQDALTPYRGRTFYVYHPAFGYFARSYGLEQKAVETGGGNPTVRELLALIEQAKAENVKVIFVQPQFRSDSAETIADAIDGVVIALDPLAEDVLSNLLGIGERIEKALSGEKIDEP